MCSGYHGLFIAAVIVCVNAAKDGGEWVVGTIGNVFGPNTAESPWRLSRDTQQSIVIFPSKGSSTYHNSFYTAAPLSEE